MIELGILAISSIANLLIGLVAYLKNSRGATNRLFLMLTFSLVSWPLFNYLSVHSQSHQLTYIRLVMFLVVVMNTAFYGLVLVFPKKRLELNTWHRLAFLYAGITAVATLTPLVFSGAYIAPDGTPSPTPAPGMALFAINLIWFVCGGLWILSRRIRTARGLERTQLRFLMAGATSMYVGAIATNFVLAVGFHWSEAVIVGPAYTVLFAAAVGYAVIKHRLFDIRFVVARSVAYVLLLTTLAGLYAAALFAVSSYLLPDTQTTTNQSLVYIGLAIVLAFTFQPLRRFFEKLTDRLLYRDSYEPQEVFNSVSKVLAEELLLDKLLRGSLEQICSSMHIEMAQLMVFDKGAVYKLAHYGPLPRKLMTAPTALRLRKTLIVADELEGGERRAIMDDHGIRVSMMLRTHDEFVGFLLLGDKLSGNIYSDQDLRTLELLAGQLSMGISNAKAYEDIAEFNLTLQQKVDEATAQLRQANAHLQETDRAKDDFISMAAHQLRTPLTTIKGYLSMMLEGDTGDLTKEQQEYAGYAYDGAERMVSLVSDLLNVSRMSSGKFMIERQPTDVVAMITDEVRQLERHAAKKGLKLIFDPPKRSMPPVDLDEGKTRQVIMNFIDNAIYYTKTGSVRVELSVSKDRFRVIVSDTGIGVPEAAQNKLFTKFFRADNAQQLRADGTGLGLYLAKRVVEDQGGTIIFESEENRGSTFGFELPLTPPRSNK